MNKIATTSEPALQIRPTKFGKGVFANRVFQKGEVILRFRGRLYSMTEYLKKVNFTKCHYMQIDKNLYLGPTTTPDNYVNHSCDPNAGLKVVNGKAYLVVIDRIIVGDEITFDYSTSMAEDHWEMDCACGAPECRSRIKDFRYLPIDLQRKYITMGIAPDFVIQSAGAQNPYTLFESFPFGEKISELQHAAPSY